MRNDIVIIALKYLEPEFSQTVKCIEATGLPVVWADRDGVGSMSRAFNDAVCKVQDQYKYYWFLTNVTFEKDLPFQLADAMDEYQLSAIHPCMKSDHPFLQPNGSMKVHLVPFIEFTAPMFLAVDFRRYMLCEQTPYWYMDLIISDQMRRDKLMLACDHRYMVDHVYLRNNKKHPVSRIREQLRDYMAPSSKIYMVNKYGKDWEQKLRFQHY